MIIPVLLLAMGLRFWGLGTTPAGLYVDEASIGYNAWSLMLTGRDEYGKALPVLLKSFGDFKTPVYSYLLVPVYRIFGMNMASTRSVSAAAGTITVLFLYALVRILGGSRKSAALGALVLALSPWHIMFSRAAIEANVALMFMTMSLWAFFKYLNGRKNFLILASVLGAVSLTAYHSQRLVIPLLFLLLGWHYRKQLLAKGNLQQLNTALIAGVVVMAPTLAVAATPAFSARAQSLNFLNLKTDELWGYVSGGGLLNNRLLLLTREWLSSYLAYFSPKYLFIAANSELRNIYPDTGPFLFWELPFLLAGAVVLIRSHNRRLKHLMVLLLAVSPLAASLVHQPFGMIRALPLVIPVSVLIAMGLDRMIARRHFLGKAFMLGLVILGLGRLYLSVFRLNDYYRYQSWDWGTDNIVREINRYPDQPVLVDGWRSELYSQLLFFTRYDPAAYQKDNPLADLADYYANGPINLIKHIGRITFKPIDYNRDVYSRGIIIGSYKMLGDREIRRFCMTKLFTLRGPDNVLIYTAARTNPGLLKEYEQQIKSRPDPEHNCLLYMPVTSENLYME